MKPDTIELTGSQVYEFAYLMLLASMTLTKLDPKQSADLKKAANDLTYMLVSEASE